MRERKVHRATSAGEAIRPRATTLEKGTISVAFVRPVVDALRARGRNAAAALRKAGIPAGVIGVPQARVSAHQYSQLWRVAIRELGDEFFGQDTRPMKPGSFALVCLAAVHAATLQDALERTARFVRVLLDDVGIEVTAEAARGRLTLYPASTARSAPRFAHETLLMMVHGLACWLVGRRIPILHGAFAYAEPAHRGEYLTLFGPSLAFDQPHTFIEFDARLLALPVVQTEATARPFLRAAPENILLKYKNTQGLAARIRRRLRQVLPRELPELETVARELNTAPATLRRRLNAEGSSYQAIKDELRRDLAILYLGSTTMSIAAIAQALGYVEPSAFHRAFRKWVQRSPGAYRLEQQAMPGIERANLARNAVKIT
jgi:AraC-like DNA-binding protein